MIESYMGPTANYAGSNSERQGVGLPGHCVRCAEHGHVKAHPDLGCGDVGCNAAHDESPHDTPRTDERAELSDEGMDLRDALCICAVLVAAGVDNDDTIQAVCHAHAGEVLRAIERDSRLTAVVAERDAAVARVTAVEVVRDRWADVLAEVYEDSPPSIYIRPEVMALDSSLRELTRALAAPVGADLSDRGEK